MLSTQPPVSVSQDETVSLIASKSYLPKFETSQVLRFRLDANPVKRLNRSQNRVPLVREEEQIGWLARKLEGVATLGDCTITAKEDLFFKKRGKAGKIVKIRFEGVLSVVDARKMDALIGQGVGPAKAFGCGLLLVRSV